MKNRIPVSESEQDQLLYIRELQAQVAHHQAAMTALCETGSEWYQKFKVLLDLVAKALGVERDEIVDEDEDCSGGDEA